MSSFYQNTLKEVAFHMCYCHIIAYTYPKFIKTIQVNFTCGMNATIFTDGQNSVFIIFLSFSKDLISKIRNIKYSFAKILLRKVIW